MSANLIGFGCDLQQKLDAMPSKRRRTRWAGDIGVELYRIAQRLHRLSIKAASGDSTASDERTERRLVDQARTQAARLGEGVEVYRQPHLRGRPLYVVFPRDVPKGSEVEAYYEQGIAVPHQP